MHEVKGYRLSGGIFSRPAIRVFQFFCVAITKIPGFFNPEVGNNMMPWWVEPLMVASGAVILDFIISILFNWQKPKE